MNRETSRVYRRDIKTWNASTLIQITLATTITKRPLLAHFPPDGTKKKRKKKNEDEKETLYRQGRTNKEKAPQGQVIVF